MSKVGKTHVVFLLDCSGSMSGKESDTIGGFNSYVEELRKDKKADYVLSAAKFDDKYEVIFNKLPLNLVPKMTPDHYFVRGSTALLDAVRKTLNSIHDSSVSHCSECGQHINTKNRDKFVVIVTTDGLENASREYSKEKVLSLIKERERKGNWTFVYFGANHDAWGAASVIGYTHTNTVNYNLADTQIMYAAAARTTSAYANSRLSSTSSFGQTVAAAMENPDLSEEDMLISLGDKIEKPKRVKRKKNEN